LAFSAALVLTGGVDFDRADPLGLEEDLMPLLVGEADDLVLD
jgi:hypothetical protein